MAFDLSQLTEEEAQLMVVAYKGETDSTAMTLATYIQGVEMLYTFKPCEQAGCLCAVMPAIAVPESDQFQIIKPFVEGECGECEETGEEGCQEGEIAVESACTETKCGSCGE